jgi:glycosyltransferase involved in cell wall biosynthesis
MKLSILVALPHYRPGWKAGGPTRTIANLVEHLGDEFSFRILTSDRDYGDGRAFPGIEVDRWQRVGKAEVLSMSPALRGVRAFAHALDATDYDVLYLNSFFHPQFTLAPLLAYRLGLARRRSCVIAPRGEFASAALRLKQRKKAAYFRTACAIGLYTGLRWQASSAFEAEDIQYHLCRIARDIAVVANLPPPVEDDAAFTPQLTGNREPLRLVLLSRVSRIKNIAFAIKAVASSPVPVHLDIWGAVEDTGYWRECMAPTGDMPDHARVEYRGHAPFDRVTEILASCDMLFLPSQGENYGHVIAESFSAGTPVLISTRTPWRNLERDGVGWVLPIDEGPAPFHRAFEEAQKRRNAEGGAWRSRVKSYAARVLLTQGTNTLVGTSPESLISAAREIIATGGKKGRLPPLWDGRAGERVAEAIGAYLEHSYGRRAA